MPLPDDLKLQFRNQLQQRLPDKTMPHITLFEELALKEGLCVFRRKSDTNPI